MGRHDGLMYHTLGQRKGLGIGGVKGMGEDPFYVVEKDLVNNVLVVAQGHDNSALLSSGLIASQLHWVDRQPICQPVRCTVKPVIVKRIFPARFNRLTMKPFGWCLMNHKLL